MKPSHFHAFFTVFIIILFVCACSKQHDNFSNTTMNSIALDKPDKQHPVLDYERCEGLYASSPKKLDGETIGSPFDIYSVETIRKRLGFEGQPSVPTDVFVWGEGEPKKPYLTKIGGLPYLPKDIPWPKDSDGQPYIFVAQICFVDSKDIVPVPIPGDVLLLFVKHDGWDGKYLGCYESDDLYFQWVRITDQPTWDQQSMQENGFRSVELSYYGVIYRTRDYERSDEINRKLDEADSFYQPYLIPALSGTKIGGIPFYIQDGPPGRGDVHWYHVSKRTWNDATYFGEFVSLQFASNVPFPWCNSEKPIGHEFGTDDSISAKGKSLMIGDMGSIYFFLKPDGAVAWLEECY